MRVPGRLKEEVSGHLGRMDGGCILSKENCPPPGYTLPEDSKFPVIFYFTHMSFSRNERGIFVVEEMKEAFLCCCCCF